LPLAERFENIIVLSDEFYRELILHPIPADLEAMAFCTVLQVFSIYLFGFRIDAYCERRGKDSSL
jgi:hypothetical protein